MKLLYLAARRMRLLAKIVKAGFSRIVEPDPQVPEPEEFEFDNLSENEPDLSDMPDMPDFENVEFTPPPREAYQAAYDELIIAAQDEVAALLSDARNEALTILQEAEEKANELRDQAWDEGYSGAYAQGKSEVDGIISKANKDADELKKQLTAEREQYLQNLELQMLGIALDVAGKILSKELDSDDQAYLSMLREAVSRVPAEDAVSIRLHPDEYTRFFNTKETKLKTSKGQMNAKLIPDPSLDRYDAIIESPSGIVDAGANTQLEQMKRNFGI